MSVSMHQHPCSSNVRRRVRYASKRYPPVDRTSAMWTRRPFSADGTPTLQHILLTVEELTGIHLDELLSPCRMLPVVRARHMYYWLARRLTKHSLTRIGLICAGKDHATVIHGIRKVDARRETFEPELSQLLSALSPGGEAPQ